MSQLSFATISTMGAILTAIAAYTGLVGLIEAILDFRAKMKARYVLSRKVQDDPELRSLIEQSNKPSEEEIEKASLAVSKALRNELSPRDPQRVEEGLHQSNKSNEWRYISMLF